MAPGETSHPPDPREATPKGAEQQAAEPAQTLEPGLSDGDAVERPKGGDDDAPSEAGARRDPSEPPGDPRPSPSSDALARAAVADAPGPTARRRRGWIGWWLATAWLLALLASGAAVAVFSGRSSGAGPAPLQASPPPSPAARCRGAWAAAASIGGAQRSARDLDPAIRACGSLDAWTRAARLYPGALDGRAPVPFLRARCRAAAARVGRSALCRSLRS